MQPFAEIIDRAATRKGGMTAHYFLRFIGKDGFIFSRDGIAALIKAGVIEKRPTGKGAKIKVQDTRWMKQATALLKSVEFWHSLSMRRQITTRI